MCPHLNLIHRLLLPPAMVSRSLPETAKTNVLTSSILSASQENDVTTRTAINAIQTIGIYAVDFLCGCCIYEYLS